MAEDIETLLHNVGNDTKALSVSFPGNSNYTLVFDNGEIIGGVENGISFDFDTRRRFSLINNKILSMSRVDADKLDEVKQWRYNYVIGIITDIMTSGKIESYDYSDEIPKDVKITYIEPLNINTSIKEASNEYNNRIDSFARVGMDTIPLDSIYLQSSLTDAENDVDLFIIFAAEAFVSLNEAISKSGGFKLSDIYEGIADRINNKDLKLVDYEGNSIYDTPDETKEESEPVYNLDDEESSESDADNAEPSTYVNDDVSEDENYYDDTDSEENDTEQQGETLLNSEQDVVDDSDASDNDEANDASLDDISEDNKDEVENIVSADDNVLDADNQKADDNNVVEPDDFEDVHPEEEKNESYDEPVEEHHDSDNVHEDDNDAPVVEQVPDNVHVDDSAPIESNTTDSSAEFIEFLDNNINAISADIETANTNIAHGEERLKELDHDEEMNTLRQEIAELKSKTARFESMLSSLKSEDDDNAPEVNDIKNSIHEAEEKLESLNKNRDWLLKTQETLKNNGLL